MQARSKVRLQLSELQPMFHFCLFSCSPPLLVALHLHIPFIDVYLKLCLPYCHCSFDFPRLPSSTYPTSFPLAFSFLLYVSSSKSQLSYTVPSRGFQDVRTRCGLSLSSNKEFSLWSSIQVQTLLSFQELRRSGYTLLPSLPFSS